MHAVPRASSLKRHFFPLLAACLLHAPANAVELDGEPVQGGLLFGTSSPGSKVLLDGVDIMVSADGRFVIGFDRDETGERTLRVREPDGAESTLTLAVAPREYAIERVDGLPPETVTPDPAALERIQKEVEMVAAARARRRSLCGRSRMRWSLV